MVHYIVDSGIVLGAREKMVELSILVLHREVKNKLNYLQIKLDFTELVIIFIGRKKHRSLTGIKQKGVDYERQHLWKNLYGIMERITKNG